MKKLILVMILIAVIAYGSMRFMETEAPQAEQPVAASRPIPVLVHQVAEVPFSETLTVIGNALARESAELTALATEKVARIQFKEGVTVKKGQLLLELEQDEQQAVLVSSRIRLEEAQREYQRAKTLAEQNFVSKAALDMAATALSQAKQEVAAAEARLRDRTIYAPFDGVLGVRNVSVGSLLNTGDFITTIDDISKIRVDMDIPERYLPFVKRGDGFTVTTQAYKDRVFTGTIAVVENRVDEVSRTVRLRGVIENPDGLLKPGMLLNVTLKSESEQILAIPEEAIIPIAKEYYVFKVDDEQKAQRVTVGIDRRFKGLVEITRGLKAGDKVITEGQLKLRDGMQVVY